MEAGGSFIYHGVRLHIHDTIFIHENRLQKKPSVTTATKGNLPDQTSTPFRGPDHLSTTLEVGLIAYFNLKLSQFYFSRITSHPLFRKPTVNENRPQKVDYITTASSTDQIILTDHWYIELDRLARRKRREIVEYGGTARRANVCLMR